MRKRSENKLLGPAGVQPKGTPEALFESGAEIAGGAVSGALAFFADGPLGAGAAGASGAVLARTIVSLAARVMSRRERVRSGAVASYALDHVARRLSWGDRPRKDLFEGGVRTDGEELFEGILVKARDEYEERKLRHLALFYANLIFDESVSVMTAHRLIKAISLLGYRQLVFLSLINQRKVVDVAGLRSHGRHSSAELEALKIEEMELLSGYIGVHGLVWNYGDYDDRLSNLGKLLVRLAELDSVPEQDLHDLSELLATCPDKAPPRYKREQPPEDE